MTRPDSGAAAGAAHRTATLRPYLRQMLLLDPARDADLNLEPIDGK